MLHKEAPSSFLCLVLHIMSTLLAPTAPTMVVVHYSEASP
jgi:hypothetical protein